MAAKPLILIVDDTPMNVKLLAEMLDEEYQLAIATSGSQALLMVQDTRPDLILLDIMMPDMNGYDVCVNLKKNPETAMIPVIFLTAKTETDDIVKGFNCGGIDYITKPFIQEVLIARVKVHIEQKELMKNLQKEKDEKDMILKEVHHRIKNNMQLIISLLTLQASTSREEQVKASLKDASSRIKSMMVLYDRLYRTTDFLNLSISRYISYLIEGIRISYPIMSSAAIETDIDEIEINAGSISTLGILMNELVTNSVKYALNENSQGRLKISLKKKDQSIVLTVSDNGPGLPENFDLNHTAGFGLHLIKILVKQLKGEMTARNRQGAEFEIIFPAE